LRDHARAAASIAGYFFTAFFGFFFSLFGLSPPMRREFAPLRGIPQSKQCGVLMGFEPFLGLAFGFLL
jgi:hypothetical protein